MSYAGILPAGWAVAAAKWRGGNHDDWQLTLEHAKAIEAQQEKRMLDMPDGRSGSALSLAALAAYFNTAEADRKVEIEERRLQWERK